MDIDAKDVNKIVDGVYKDVSTKSTSESKKSSADNSLGKEAFLQLLVTQMQYQDPLNPQQDTEFISQLAQFSSLEQMQNLNETFSNTSALNLVGKTVTVTETDSSGKSHTVTGVVDFVTRDSKGNSRVSVNGSTYSADDVSEVFDDVYLISKKLPTVEAASVGFDHSAPEDIKIELSLGKDEYEASGVAVMVGDKTIDSKYLKYKDGTLTIDKEAFAEFEAGTYGTAFVFSNALYTTVTDKVYITVKGIRSGQETEQPEPEQD